VHAVVLAQALAALVFPACGFAAEPIPAEASFSSAGGFARLVLKFSEDVGSEVVTAGSIIVIRFEHRLTFPSTDWSRRRRTISGRRVAIPMARRFACRCRAR
jgi:hypothetical protein